MSAGILEGAAAGYALVDYDGRLSEYGSSLVTRTFIDEATTDGVFLENSLVVDQYDAFAIVGPQLVDASDELCGSALRLAVRETASYRCVTDLTVQLFRFGGSCRNQLSRKQYE